LHESDSNLGTVQIPVAAAVKTFAPIIERLLELILEESTRQHNQVEKEAVLVLLPRLREYLSELSTRNMSDVIKELLLRASKSMHYITEQDQTDLCDIMLARWYYSDLLLLDTAGDDSTRLVTAVIGTPGVILPRDAFKVMSNYLTLRRRLLKRMATMMTNAEARDAWEAVLHFPVGPKSTADVVRTTDSIRLNARGRPKRPRGRK
jgi:hypothetical protein